MPCWIPYYVALAEGTYFEDTHFNEISPHVEYSITNKGEGLIVVYYEYKWSVKYELGD